MKSQIPYALALILLAPLVVLALQVQPVNVRMRDLKSKSFTVGSLKITLTKFYQKALPHQSILNSDQSMINIEIENTSGDMATFNPQMLTFIDKDNYQVNIIGQYSSSGAASGVNMVAAVDRKVWPNAKIKHIYGLTDNVQLPARLYYDDKLLATITE